ncbi:nucleotidyltransferase domain-containing protein [Tardiphaga alba]|uniref:Nucleotidyltransferase domain-containing protein n=1 Tax=Tardiphaga alba TaxID=340268 RepID=A0ABX8A6F8_9BRAD|nr:nucleotidyltransferase domain-containing protein [Tardiphaga alba]QUS39238.1 nucleotidyltransferase domain-containing protein [Tardiphaga alba]
MTDVIDIPLETILAKLRALAPAIKAEGVTRLAVFGSRARDDARPDSDLDILVEYPPYREGPPFFRWSKVMNMIEDEIGVWPHVMTDSELTPRIRERMADDLIEVF